MEGGACSSPGMKGGVGSLNERLGAEERETGRWRLGEWGMKDALGFGTAGCIYCTDRFYSNTLCVAGSNKELFGQEYH